MLSGLLIALFVPWIVQFGSSIINGYFNGKVGCYTKKVQGSLQATSSFVTMARNSYELKKIKRESDLVQDVINWLESETDQIHGRKFVDAAFYFSLAGIEDNSLFDLLANYTENELKRFGHRNSCQVVHILQMVEKLAVAGVRNHSVFQTAKDIIVQKQSISTSKSNETYELIKSYDNFNLFSDRALLWLWRFASKNVKKGLQMKTNQPVYSKEYFTSCTDFEDTQLPLIIDIGCGYGVSLLAMAMNIKDGKYQRRVNFLGVDMNEKSITYANGIAKRWALDNFCKFVYSDATSLIEYINKFYIGGVSLILLNFPTPYAISCITDDGDSTRKSVGNSQLPQQFQDFILNKELLSQLTELKVNKREKLDRAIFLAQSNNEDVALTMRNLLLSTPHWRSTPTSELQNAISDILYCNLVEVSNLQHQDPANDDLHDANQRGATAYTTQPSDVVDLSDIMSKRQRIWLQHQGTSALTRAYGDGWLSRNPLPYRVRSETEVVSEIMGKPIYRFALTYTTQVI